MTEDDDDDDDNDEDDDDDVDVDDGNLSTPNNVLMRAKLMNPEGHISRSSGG